MTDGDRWVSQRQLAQEVGYTTRQLRNIEAEEPGVLVARPKKGGRGSVQEYRQPQCAINLRERAVRQASDRLREQLQPGDSNADLIRRERLVRVRREEIELEAQLRRFIDIDEATAAYEAFLARLRPAWQSFGARVAPTVLHVDDLAVAKDRIDAAMDAMMGELAEDSAPTMALPAAAA
jgi:hypothetical protein